VDDQQRQLKRTRVEETLVCRQQIVDRCVVSATRRRPVVHVVVDVIAVEDLCHGRSQLMMMMMMSELTVALQILDQLSQPRVKPQARHSGGERGQAERHEQIATHYDSAERPAHQHYHARQNQPHAVVEQIDVMCRTGVVGGRALAERLPTHGLVDDSQQVRHAADDVEEQNADDDDVLSNERRQQQTTTGRDWTILTAMMSVTGNQ